MNTIAGAFGLVIGIVGLWTGFRQLRNRKALDRWPTTKGRVIERGTYQPNIPTMSTSAFRHAPLVRYAYQVNGQELINDSVCPKRIQLPPHNTKAWAQKLADSFPVELAVHYNPANPRESFLVQTPKRMLYIVIGAAAAVIPIAALFLLK